VSDAVHYKLSDYQSLVRTVGSIDLSILKIKRLPDIADHYGYKEDNTKEKKEKPVKKETSKLKDIKKTYAKNEV